MNCMLDSGSGPSIIDLCTVRTLGLTSKIVPNEASNVSVEHSKRDLVDASGNKMNIVGTVVITVSLPGTPDRRQTFQVLDANSHSTLLLGRDFMSTFGAVKFDFQNNRVQMGRKWINGLSMGSRKNVRLNETVTIAARTEQVVQVRCKDDLALLTGDFTPKHALCVKGVYASRARVIPNVDGVFQISLLNVSETDVVLKSRKLLGALHPAGNLVCELSNPADKRSGIHTAQTEPDLSATTYGRNLSRTC